MSTSHQLAQALVSLVRDDAMVVSDAVSLFARFLEKRNLIGYTTPIVRHIQQIAQQEKEHATVRIESNNKISKETLLEIAQTLGASSASSIVIQENKTLIAGFVATYGYEVYDASMKTQLEKLRTVLQD